MQETIPILEQELEDLVVKFIENQARARVPMMRQITRHRVFEGKKSIIVRPDGEEDDTEFREFSRESEIPRETIPYSTFEAILACFIPVAEAMASDHDKMLIEVMNHATEKTGNIVNARGQPLSHEKILEMLEVIEIDFDTYGNPRMPTMMISPAMEPRLRQLLNDPITKEFEEKKKAIIDKKRMEWRAREANRALVG